MKSIFTVIWKTQAWNPTFQPYWCFEIQAIAQEFLAVCKTERPYNKFEILETKLFASVSETEIK